MVRNGLGVGDVKFAISFLDWRWRRSCSAVVLERSSMKQRLQHMLADVNCRGARARGWEGGPFGFAVYFVFGEGDVFDVLCSVNLICPTPYILIASPLSLTHRTPQAPYPV